MWRNYEDNLYLAASSAPQGTSVLIAHKLPTKKTLQLARRADLNGLHLHSIIFSAAGAPDYIGIPRSKNHNKEFKIQGFCYVYMFPMKSDALGLKWDSYRRTKKRTKNSHTTLGGTILLNKDGRWIPVFVWYPYKAPTKTKHLPAKKPGPKQKLKTGKDGKYSFTGGTPIRSLGYANNGWVHIIYVPMGGQNEYHLGGTHHY